MENEPQEKKPFVTDIMGNPKKYSLLVKNVTLHNLLGISLEQTTPAQETMRRLLDGAARHILYRDGGLSRTFSRCGARARGGTPTSALRTIVLAMVGSG
jgi:hypothetical protein